MGRLFINKNYFDIVDAWSKNKSVLDFNSIENIEKFSLIASMGIDNPINVQSRRDYIRYESIPTKYKSILSSIVLGKINDEDVDLFANEDVCFDESEKCFESGFNIFKEKIDSSNGDEELFMKRMLSEIDLMYENTVKDSIKDMN